MLTTKPKQRGHVVGIHLSQCGSATNLTQYLPVIFLHKALRHISLSPFAAHYSFTLKALTPWAFPATMADDAFSTSYVYKTNPNPYHELVVQSQKMINDALYNMWAVADSGSPLLSLSLEVKNVGSIDASLNEPTVRLNVTTSSPQLYFFVTFSSGTLKLYTADDPTTDPSTKTWDITGWKFAFPVTIGMVFSSIGEEVCHVLTCAPSSQGPTHSSLETPNTPPTSSAWG